MMESPDITILMPVLNGEKFIKQSIDSILNQSFTNFELLIINDGSTDDTQQIINTYTDPRIKYIQQKNLGVARTLNKGIQLAQGKYIRRHDADDFSEPNMLKVQIQFLKDHPEFQFVGTRCAFMTDRGKVAYSYTQPKIHLFEESKSYLTVTRVMFNPYSPIVHGTVLGPTAIFKEMNGYRTEFLTSEDNDLWLRIIEKYKFAVLKHPYYHLRLSTNSATQKHKSTTNFYRNLCLAYADERAIKGTDPIQRGELVPLPKSDKSQQLENKPIGKKFRADVFDFNYQVNVNAKDYHNIIKNILTALRDGWLLSDTYKAILIPWFDKGTIRYVIKLKKTIVF